MTNQELDAKVIELDHRRGELALNAVLAFLSRFVSYPSDHALVAHTLWIAHTHLIEVFDTTPRLAFLSAEPASGKTRALEATELLVPRPLEAVNMSPAALFRSFARDEEEHDGGLPTLLYDEIDTVFGPKAKENEELRGLLNAGHRRGAKAYRCVVRGKSVGVEAIEAFCPVALAGLGWLPDTILTRSVVVRMRRRAPTEIVEQFRRRLVLGEGLPVGRPAAGATAATLAIKLTGWPGTLVEGRTVSVVVVCPSATSCESGAEVEDSNRSP